MQSLELSGAAFKLISKLKVATVTEVRPYSGKYLTYKWIQEINVQCSPININKSFGCQIVVV